MNPSAAGYFQPGVLKIVHNAESCVKFLTSVVCLLQTTRDRFMNKQIDVTIREINRRNRKITLNMVEAAQILAYRNLKVCRRPIDPY